ncbi:hypothetical protein P9D43_29200 [Neobacillus niacini]|uniref:hypothetical protein n=1 Tax=Neobacillus niacini TaxID=86668 RepID=UPI0007AB5EB5|nr:hypothetical protein [Neobacillus niacini]MEC1526073.1 hypothetical protein [Neobacillus niacini]
MTKAHFNTDGRILRDSGRIIYFKKGGKIEVIGEDHRSYFIRILTGKHKGQETKVYKEDVDLD